MVSEEFSLNGKTALVAGDSRFWSKYVAAALAEAGADVAVAASSSQRLKEAADEAERLGRKIVTIPTDMTDPSQVNKMVGQAVTDLGKIDILVNATDLEFAKPFLEITRAEWQQVMDTNLNSIFYSCQSVAKHMLSTGKGRIVNIISCLAERGLSHGSAYCVSMGGVLQLTRALALEWAREGITVNAIGTGCFAETDRTGALDEDRLLRYLPLKRYGHPSEVGSMVVYLASDTTDFVTGQFFYADGGLMAHA
jgi:NAD(P)-dependent dehydrogenase (short-subunit alcohol dehydrogenase family)